MCLSCGESLYNNHLEDAMLTTIKLESGRYEITRFDYPSEGEKYYDGRVNRVICAKKAIVSKKHVIVRDITK
jgi:hypothetical protein